MVKISHIAKNMRIKKIGTLFKKHNSKDGWNINLILEDESKVLETTYTNFSNGVSQSNAFLERWIRKFEQHL